MKTRTSLLVLLATVLPAYASAQTAVSPGDRVRITHYEFNDQAAGRSRLSGTLASSSSEEVSVTDDEGTTHSFTKSSIIRIERRTSTGGNQALKYGLIGFLGGAAMGFGITAGDDCSDSFSFECTNTATALWALGLIFGGVGGVKGHGKKSDGWEPASLPSSPTASISIRPTFTNGIGFAASIPVGGH